MALLLTSAQPSYCKSSYSWPSSRGLSSGWASTTGNPNQGTRIRSQPEALENHLEWRRFNIIFTWLTWSALLTKPFIFVRGTEKLPTITQILQKDEVRCSGSSVVPRLTMPWFWTGCLTAIPAHTTQGPARFGHLRSSVDPGPGAEPEPTNCPAGIGRTGD